MSDVKNPISSYRDLVVWQKGMDLAKAIYRLTSSFPKEGAYGLNLSLATAYCPLPTAIS